VFLKRLLTEKIPENFKFIQAVRLLVHRDLQQRTSGTVLGYFWLLLQAIFLLAVYTFVFGSVLGVRFIDGGDTDEYAIYLMAALLPFLGFQEGVTRSATILTENRELISKVVFPPLLLPLSVVLSSLATELIGLFVLAVAIAIRDTLSWTLVLLPLLLVVRLMMTLSLAWLMSVLTAFLRDLGQAMGMLLTVLMFATPILYPASRVPREWQWILNMNPLTYLVDAYRMVMIEGVPPDGDFYLLAILSFGVMSLSLYLFDHLIERAKDFL
jgi:ABC-type polysaccharide/polyol phosphate export permease